MDFLRFSVGFLLTILLVVASVNGASTNIPIGNTSTNLMTTMNASTITSHTQTTAPITTARATSEEPTSQSVTSTAPMTSYSPTSSATTSVTSTKPVPVTTPEPGRKFDGLSFVGGMILAGGLAGLIFLVVTYLRRTNRAPSYANLS